MTLPFLTYKLYNFIGRMGILFESGIEYAVLCVVLMVLLGLVVRVGTDEIAPIFENAAKAVQETPRTWSFKAGPPLFRDVRHLSKCSPSSATALMVLVLVDMAWACTTFPSLPPSAPSCGLGIPSSPSSRSSPPVTPGRANGIRVAFLQDVGRRRI